MGVAKDVAAEGDGATGSVGVRATNVLVTLSCLSCSDGRGVVVAEDAMIKEVGATL